MKMDSFTEEVFNCLKKGKASSVMMEFTKVQILTSQVEAEIPLRVHWTINLIISHQIFV